MGGTSCEAPCPIARLRPGLSRRPRCTTLRNVRTGIAPRFGPGRHGRAGGHHLLIDSARVLLPGMPTAEMPVPRRPRAMNVPTVEALPSLAVTVSPTRSL